MNVQSTLVANFSVIAGLCENNDWSVIETHISWVLLTGDYAYKIKKSVDFGFLDFSTLEKRKFCCDEELRLNRRLASDLYIGVIPITGSVSKPQLEGNGPIVEYAVKMKQFAAGQLLSNRAEQQKLSLDEIDQLARLIAGFHEQSEVADINSPYGDGSDINHWFMENFAHIEPLLSEDRQRLQLQLIKQWGEKTWHELAGLLRQRKQQGYIREVHGDLHLANIVLIDGRVVPFDCIEFNPMLRWIDLMSELAYICVDLLSLNYASYAYRLLNLYLQHTGDYNGLRLFRYYSIYRALVRAKVTLLRAVQEQGCINGVDKHSLFFDLAEQHTKKPVAMLIITHGYSCAGKSTYSSRLAEHIGAIQIRSDVERKRLFKLPALSQNHSDIGQGMYSPQADELTYQRLKILAQTVLDAGFSVIIDATFLMHWQRELFNQFAISRKVPFLIVNIVATEQELCRRVGRRRNDVSEATVSVVKNQLLTAQPLTEQEQQSAFIVDSESEHAWECLLEHYHDFLARTLPADE